MLFRSDFSDAKIAYLLSQPLTAPAPNQTVTVHVQAGEQIPVAFNPADAQVSLQGGNLVLTFADGGKIILEGFAMAAPEVTIIFPDGTIVAGNIIVAQVGEQPNIDLETAAGPTGPTTGGVGEYREDLGSVIDPLHAQGVLGPTELQFPSLPLTEDLTPELTTFGAPTAGDVEGLVWERDLNAHFQEGIEESYEPICGPDGTNPDGLLERITGFLPFSGGTITDVSLLGYENVDEEGGGSGVVLDKIFTSPEHLEITATGGVGGQTIWILTVNTITGEFVFELFCSIYHPDQGANGEQVDLNDIINILFSYTVTGPGGVAIGHLTIGITDDGPILLSDEQLSQHELSISVAVDEDDLNNFNAGTGFGSTGNHDEAAGDDLGSSSAISVTRSLGIN